MFTPYLFLIYLICVMMICNIIKENNLFIPLYGLITKKVKSKKFLVFLVSCLSGILPIPGRVVVSAGMLDTLVDKEKTASRSKFGIVDFLATHHYYWWSPLEKTVIIPMAALGLTYLQFMSYTCIPLLICLLFTFYYIFVFIDEKDMYINKSEHINNKRSIILSTMPILLSIFLLCFKIEPYYIFPFTLIFYIIYCKEYQIKKLVSYVDWKLILLVVVVIFSSELVAKKSDLLLSYIKHISRLLNIQTLLGFLVISIIAFTITFILGSSSKYAGIVVLLTSLFGMKYFVYFLTLEFFAYIMSPTHKCVLISSKYFNTPLKDYYKVLSIWGTILLLYGSLTIMLK